ncbi:Uncharacterised protein [Clostridioides difficile]|nr:Uncharacterised protein [Clostridioides difficile]
MGIMSAVQLKTLALGNVTNEVAVSTGFSSATMVAVGIGIIGLILAFTFGLEKVKEKSKKSIILE